MHGGTEYKSVGLLSLLNSAVNRIIVKGALLFTGLRAGAAADAALHGLSANEKNLRLNPGGGQGFLHLGKGRIGAALFIGAAVK